MLLECVAIGLLMPLTSDVLLAGASFPSTLHCYHRVGIAIGAQSAVVPTTVLIVAFSCTKVK